MIPSKPKNLNLLHAYFKRTYCKNLSNKIQINECFYSSANQIFLCTRDQILPPELEHLRTFIRTHVSAIALAQASLSNGAIENNQCQNGSGNHNHHHHSSIETDSALMGAEVPMDATNPEIVQINTESLHNRVYLTLEQMLSKQWLRVFTNTYLDYHQHHIIQVLPIKICILWDSGSFRHYIEVRDSKPIIGKFYVYLLSTFHLKDKNKKRPRSGVPPKLSGCVCAYHPATPGLSPKHVTCAFFIYRICELFVMFL